MVVEKFNLSTLGSLFIGSENYKSNDVESDGIARNLEK